ncbi:MAG: ABC transporter substrate-binding protein [Candidatus Nezhaarchaeales archaeon]
MEKKEGVGLTKVQAIAIVVVVVVIVAGVAAYFLTLPPPGPAAPEYIKIGWPAPITGGIAAFAETTPWMVEQVEKYVNNVMGGVYLAEYGKKVPIKIILRDIKSDSDAAASVAAELITRENVDLMLALYSPAMTNPISAQCERYGVPCIVSQTIIVSWLMGGPYTWSYCIGLAEPDYAVLFFDLFDTIKDKTNKVVALINSDDPDGRATAAAWKAQAEKRGYTIVDLGLIPYGTKDFSTYVEACKKAGADILTGNMIPTDFASFWRQCNEMSYKPKLVAMARSLLFPSWVAALGGDLGNGLVGYIWWTPYHPYESSLTGQTPQDLCQAWETYSGKQWTPVLGMTHAVLEVAVKAIEKAGSLDKAKIRDALANIDLNTIVGRVNFKAPLTSSQQARYQAFENMIKYKDHYVVVPPVAIQWVKVGERWDPVIIYNWESPDIPVTGKLFLLN